MTTRGIRRKKSSLSEVRIAVIGANQVGKSALSVRFLTKRYIGEYDHQTENRYKHEAMVDGEPVLFEILDTCPKMEGNEITNTALDAIQWADGILLVYSITDRQSFNYIKRAKIEIQSDIPVSLVGNKVDMIHLRQVSADEGDILAKDFDCKFSELSAAENVVQVADVFHELCKDVLNARRKSKQSLLDRMLGGTRVYARGKSDSALPKD
ncbi:ras-related and estrogen-regulated growth inhibitor [Contarinia nasturtii]|uniref:ras-related and estrogen-regulated growth inhibitor n=1 Tax=Contarinia nasturtii TaxID=265458 RepID=UPI0012D3BFB1|nr:ras-related and estrogen-regulated growth inhibitor [Contarinia nasturtii]XP_031630086.1 ras-related and estrogen-regulated growth inhibitor [Contarinia nasturtii]XP_031630087.1 ras-related and estrogen-regulated growth inhibitor [Contarinia nasturtii]XP_031630088.1 ras-related and estrogen-regulated growth inhibitor [Contarinia nasturtii]